MLSTTQLRALWGPRCCEASQLTHFSCWSGAAKWVRKGTEEAWQALDDVMKFYKYAPRPADTGAFNCRKITGGTGLSLHSFGIASDTNWTTNPYGPTLVTDRPAPMISALAAIRTKGGLQVFRWGGTYPGNKDAMHDEICISPADLAVGINWKTVAGHTPQPPPEDPNMGFSDVEITYIANAGGRIPSVLNLYAEAYGPTYAPDKAGLGYWIDQSMKIDYWTLRSAFLTAVAGSLKTAGVALTGAALPLGPSDQQDPAKG